jgi:surfeit locus 1 family protein
VSGKRGNGELVPSLAVGAALAVLIALGIWQLGRKAWKEALIDTLTHRLAMAPIELPGPAEWSRLEAPEAEFRRVKLSGEFMHEREALVYARGSALRSDASTPGYWVFTPLAHERSVILVNRGFVPDGRQDPRTRTEGQVTSPVTVVGALRWPEQRGVLTPRDDPGRNLWFVRDPAAIAAGKGLSAVAPFYIEQEAPVPPGGLPHPSALAVRLRNDHLQYALTWFGLAAVLVVVAAFWMRARRTADNNPAGP